ncbi:transmembrane and immunoglobulin domain-containing protein 1 [Callorhinchus milii]|uniref:Ig-like domain-containing protein n=1 Tax=Callorhinchus milii TaxID=7868 RepID=A0A4W3IPB1_CALMI|nr:transmembrane and immunoglobulin domain-containing protein 1 [Callorhinchus milii]|eukprot:gi/632965610/ref/XP_007898977.1/ PREDICTED: transmembrane and immunoglobulin domain-containing protein 1 [Callorhinchus milii]
MFLERVWNIIVGLSLIAVLCFIHGCAGVYITINNINGPQKLTRNISDSISLQCKAVNNTQSEKLVWFRGRSQVRLSSLNEVNTSTVCIDPLKEEDDQIVFSCRLKRKQNINSTVALDILFAPILSADSDVYVDASEETDRTFTCNAKSNPQAIMVWYKDNRTLKLESGRHSVNLDSNLFRLSIKMLLKTDNGTYSCVAISPLGSKALDFYLLVRDKVIPAPIEPIIAGSVVVLITIIFAIASRRQRIIECCKGESHSRRFTESEIQ